MGVENASDELRTEISNSNTHHVCVRPLLELAVGKIMALFQVMDSGNREAAEAYAEKIAKENAKLFR